MYRVIDFQRNNVETHKKKTHKKNWNSPKEEELEFNKRRRRRFEGF